MGASARRPLPFALQLWRRPRRGGKGAKGADAPVRSALREPFWSSLGELSLGHDPGASRHTGVSAREALQTTACARNCPIAGT
eukprot:4946743-Alexandrium_andersonii.AAC.1